MKIHRTPLAKFNACMMLSKSDIIESFNVFVAHHREHDNKETYSEHKRKVLLSLCDRFNSELEKCNIPALTKPWFYYDYFVKNDCIELSLLKCNGDLRFDEHDRIVSMASSLEYTLIRVPCEYLTVEQYANLYHVSPTTVRQWIRRGKLRTAQKEGRDWLIPSLTDKPDRGFEQVTYVWETLSEDIIATFPFLASVNHIHLYQDTQNKKVFYAISFWPNLDNIQRETLTIKQREQLELLLIADPNVSVKDPGVPFNFAAAKNSASLPVLSYQDNAQDNMQFDFTDIYVKQYSQEITGFSPFDAPRTPPYCEFSAAYLVPVQWVFWGVPADDTAAFVESAILGDFSSCARIGTLHGNLLLCKQMIADGYSPLTICETESDDLVDALDTLFAEEGPLNEATGDPYQNVFYIGELNINESLRDIGLGSRILQELPRLCANLLHVIPDILVYYPDAKDDFRAEVEFDAFSDLDITDDHQPKWEYRIDGRTEYSGSVKDTAINVTSADNDSNAKYPADGTSTDSEFAASSDNDPGFNNHRPAAIGKIIPFIRKADSVISEDHTPDAAYNITARDSIKKSDHASGTVKIPGSGTPQQPGHPSRPNISDLPDRSFQPEVYRVISFYQKNGFQEIGQKRIFYTTVRM